MDERSGMMEAAGGRGCEKQRVGFNLFSSGHHFYAINKTTAGFPVEKVIVC